MKKALAILLSVVFVFSLCACGKSAASSDTQTHADSASGTSPETTVEYDLSGTETTEENTTFGTDVIVIGKNGKIEFRNCTFKGNLINRGGEGAVCVLSSCNFEGDAHLIIDSELKEATMDTVLPKFINLGDSVNVECTNAGSALTIRQSDLIFNGETYKFSDCDRYVDGEGNELDRSSADECSYHICGVWWENGEKVAVHLGVTD